MSSCLHMPATIAVVDANPTDYVAFTSLVEAGKADVRYLLSGRSALRQAEQLRSALWLINVQLPDRSGFDLFEMYSDSFPRSAVFLVSDDYREEDELRALRLGAAKYLCKPPDASWLLDWREWTGTTVPAKVAREPSH